MKIHKLVKIALIVILTACTSLAVFGKGVQTELFLLVPALFGILYWRQILDVLASINLFPRRIAFKDKLKDSLPAFLNFAIATCIYFALFHLDFGEYTKMEQALIFGLYLITAVIMMKRLNELLLLAVLPRVRKTETVLDDQILLFVFATLKYSIIPIAIYVWLVYGLDIVLNDWAKAGFAISVAAVGFAFRNIINDFIASVIINMEQEIMVKDYITVNNHTGKVWKIEPRYTILKSLKGEEFIIPNSDLINNAVVNHSKRQFISIYLNFWIKHHVKIDTDALKDFIQEECSSDLLTDHELSSDPLIHIYKTDLKDDSVQYTITFLIKSSKEGSGKVIYTENKRREREINEKIFDYVHTHLPNN